jgi:hypothetical protein
LEEGGPNGSVQDRGRGRDLPVRHTFLWFLPSFLGAAITVEGAIWLIIQLLVLTTVGYHHRRPPGARLAVAGPVGQRPGRLVRD